MHPSGDLYSGYFVVGVYHWDSDSLALKKIRLFAATCYSQGRSEGGGGGSWGARDPPVGRLFISKMKNKLYI